MKTYRVAVAGSRDVSPLAGISVLKLLLHLGAPTVVMRRGRTTEPGPLETEIADLARVAGCPIEWRVPGPGGRDEVFLRDIEMVGTTDLLVAVFSSRRVMEGGTAHLVEKAIDQRVPAYAFVFDPDEPAMIRVGEYDPDNTWGVLLERI